MKGFSYVVSRALSTVKLILLFREYNLSHEVEPVLTFHLVVQDLI